MGSIRVLYREHPGHGWSADSPDRPGWRVFGDSYEDARQLAEDGVRFVLDCEAEDRREPAPTTFPPTSTTHPLRPDRPDGLIGHLSSA
jgi:predicted RNase H-like HicB family nuclease